MKVSVITVNFNQPGVTEELLATIPAIEDLEVIVVDNGSEKDASSQLQAKYPTVKFIRSEKNLGFAGGNNLGIKQAAGDYLFL
ncbi:putative glycosyl transferase [Mucilaginibacter gotjawali]|uniref:Putative glycosyl transferase n=1 Tax=Mucilaginibacter gotjawali TaxID=1550579 RepID=A0A0X8X3C6_9SPHI|nr:glycosyltransferase [Mucilaginibacter gotjawali]BAU54975.1 putative glycosyl transferase [Mucilaginibacter gotjawali]